MLLNSLLSTRNASGISLHVISLRNLNVIFDGYDKARVLGL